MTTALQTSTPTDHSLRFNIFTKQLLCVHVPLKYMYIMSPLIEHFPSTQKSQTSLVMQTHSSGNSFPDDTTPVEFRFEDVAGKIAQCVFNVVLSQAG